MIPYNTSEAILVLPEYGRNIQRLIDHCVMIEDKEERTRCAYAIADVMATLFPSIVGEKGNRQKIWDHINIMSKFELDIDFPCEVIDKDQLSPTPSKIPYNSNLNRYRHYGKNIQEMIIKVADMENCVEKDQLITGEKVKAGDVLIGLPSSGIHSNGYSLVRKILFKDNDIDLNRYEDSLGMTVKEAVLAPTKIYVKPILSLITEIGVHGMAHITGGGFDENIPRALPKGCGVKIDKNSYPIPPVFNYLRDLGNLEEREMYNVFNMGIGMVIIVDRQDAEKAMQILKNCDEEPYIIGEVIEGEGVQLV